LASIYDPLVDIENPLLVLIVGCIGLAMNIAGMALFHGTHAYLWREGDMEGLLLNMTKHRPPRARTQSQS
jgi:Co/Zn/Cd efflux system component